MTPPQPGDKSAAFAGLFVASIVIATVLYGVVQWTNVRFEGHGAQAGAQSGAQSGTKTGAH